MSKNKIRQINRQPAGMPGQMQQIRVDVENATPKVCECGCKYFIPVVVVFTVSALMSPTGQELTAQQPVLVCMDCKKPL